MARFPGHEYTLPTQWQRHADPARAPCHGGAHPRKTRAGLRRGLPAPALWALAEDTLPLGAAPLAPVA